MEAHFKHRAPEHSFYSFMAFDNLGWVAVAILQTNRARESWALCSVINSPEKILFLTTFKPRTPMSIKRKHTLEEMAEYGVLF